MIPIRERLIQMSLIIRKALATDIYSLVNLINLTSKNLIEKGINQWEYPCDRRKVEEELEEGLIFMLESHGKIIGSFSIKDISTFDAIKLNKPVKYLYRVIISPNHQGNKLGNTIIQHLREVSGDIYLDCWAGNHKLKQFYTGNDCIYLGDFPEEDYMISVYRV